MVRAFHPVGRLVAKGMTWEVRPTIRSLSAWSGIVGVVLSGCARSDDATVTVSMLTSIECMCTLDLELIAQLDPEAGLSAPTLVLFDSIAGFLAVDAYTPYRVASFDRSGIFRQHIGRRGEGPGEFRSITGATLTSDSHLHLYDSNLARVTVLDGDLAVEEILRGPPAGSWPLMLRPGEWVTTLRPNTSQNRSLVVFEHDRERVRFGRESRTPVPSKRILAGSGNGFWAVHPLDYGLKQWTDAGKLIRVYERDIAWFQPWPDARFVSDGDPRTYLRAIAETAPDELTVALAVARNDWEEHQENPANLEVRR